MTLSNSEPSEKDIPGHHRLPCALLSQPPTAPGVFVPAGVHPPRAEHRQLDQIARAGAELTRSVENQRRAATASGRVVLVGPTPQQFIESASDLLARIPALCHSISQDRPKSPCH